MRRIPLSRRSHIIGFQPLPTGTVEHESALERDFVLLTLFDDPAVRVRSQPVTLNFVHEGRQRRYTPDYLVEGSGRFEVKTGKGLGAPITCDVKTMAVRLAGDKLQINMA